LRTSLINDVGKIIDGTGAVEGTFPQQIEGRRQAQQKVLPGAP